MTGVAVDGMDVVDVYRAAREAVLRARNGNGPTLLDCRTYRFLGHYIGDPDLRAKEEKEEWLKKDPIAMFADSLKNQGVASTVELARVNDSLETEVKDAVDFAMASPYPPPEDALKDVFAVDRVSPGNIVSIAPGSRELTFRDAINEAMREEMKSDPNVIIYGQGYMGQRGGPYQVGRGLQDTFGKERVRDAPISELAMVGVAAGAAMTGLRPIVEIQFIDFTTLAMDQLVNHAGKTHYMFAGQFKVPMVVRTTIGAFTYSGAHHSQSLEAWFMHSPGLKVIIPSTPYDAKGLLKAAIRDDNPCLFLEAKAIYGMKGPVPEQDYVIPLGTADVKREGKDATVVTWSRMVHLALTVAKRLEAQGISVEVIDLRTLVPLDKRSIIESVKKTGRLVVLYEGYRTGGGGAEIAAIVAEEAFQYLKAPIMRVANPGVPVPFSPALEALVLPSEERVEKAVRETLKSR